MNTFKENMRRLFKNKSFYIFILVIIGFTYFFCDDEIGVISLSKHSFESNMQVETLRGFKRLITDNLYWPLALIDPSDTFNSYLDYEFMNSFLSYITFVMFLSSIFNVFFLGQENAYRTINNKISRGISRLNIYFSGFFTTLIADILMLLTSVIVVKVIAMMHGANILLLKNTYIYFLIILLLQITFTSITTFLSLFFTKRNLVLVIGSLVLFGAINIGNAIYSSYWYNTHNAMDMEQIEYNVKFDYTKTFKYKAERTLIIMNPCSLEMSTNYEHSQKSFHYDLGHDDNAIYFVVNIIYITTFLIGGAYLFNRKELT